MAEDGVMPNKGASSQGDENSNQLHVWCAIKTNMDQSREKALGLFTEAGGNFKHEEDGEHLMIGGNTYDTIASMPTREAEGVELALVSVKQIGFIFEPTYKEIIDRISKSRKIGFCQTAEEIIWAHTLSIHQELNHRVSLPFSNGKIYFRLEKHRDSKGKLNPWLLEGVYNPERICDLNELFIVRLLKKAERGQPRDIVVPLNQVLSSLKDYLSKKQNPTL